MINEGEEGLDHLLAQEEAARRVLRKAARAFGGRGLHAEPAIRFHHLPEIVTDRDELMQCQHDAHIMLLQDLEQFDAEEHEMMGMDHIRPEASHHLIERPLEDVVVVGRMGEVMAIGRRHQNSSARPRNAPRKALWPIRSAGARARNTDSSISGCAFR